MQLCRSVRGRYPEQVQFTGMLSLDPSFLRLEHKTNLPMAETSIH